MAFIPYAYQSGAIAPWVWLPAGDAAWTVGQAAIIASGKCEPVASGTGQDTDEGVHYIAMFDETIAAANDGAVRPFLSPPLPASYSRPLWALYLVHQRPASGTPCIRTARASPTRPQRAYS